MTHAQLDASVGASGPHDFAVRNTIARQYAADRSRETRPAIHDCAPHTAASTASRRTSVTIAIRPFVGRDGRINKAVSTKAGSEIFLRMGLDTIVAEQPVGQISWVRKRAEERTWRRNPAARSTLLVPPPCGGQTSERSAGRDSISPNSAARLCSRGLAQALKGSSLRTQGPITPSLKSEKGLCSSAETTVLPIWVSVNARHRCGQPGATPNRRTDVFIARQRRRSRALSATTPSAKPRPRSGRDCAWSPNPAERRRSQYSSPPVTGHRRGSESRC
jgi:hypothetical protein